MSKSEVSGEEECAAFPSFVERHVGPNPDDIGAMLVQIGYESVESLIADTIPEKLRFRKPLALPEADSEFEVLRKLRAISLKNRVAKSYIGLGYHACVTPPVIQRHILENAGWYTAYTPYQAEIAQGRLEALVNFQTMVTDLTGLEIANASLLDEGTAAAESMAMLLALATRQCTHHRPPGSAPSCTMMRPKRGRRSAPSSRPACRTVPSACAR